MKIFVDGTKLIFGEHLQYPTVSIELGDDKTFLALMKAASIARGHKTNNLSISNEEINTVDKAEAFVQECIKIMQDAAMSVKKG